MNFQSCQTSHSQDAPIDMTHAINSPVKRIRYFLQQVWQHLSHILANDEPRVWQRVNRRGEVISWHIYDPRSGYTVQLGSEMEVRLWLEHRFYQ